MKEVLISIIIPVYNVESKINLLLTSLYKIKSKNIEIIFVDNNSKDNSLNILNNYAKKDKRSKVYKENKSGANYARYYGFKKSTGKYIYFVDSDDYEFVIDKYLFFDYIEVNNFNKVLDILNKKEVDILIGNYNELDSNGNFIKLMNGFGNENILLYKPCLWNKIIKKELIKDNSFIFNTIGEDMYLTLPILASSNKIEYFNKPIYNYIKNDNGLSAKNNYKLLSDALDSLKLLRDKFIKDNLYESNKEGINFVFITHSSYRAFKGILLNKEDRNKIRSKVLEFINELNYKDNKYYKKSTIYKLVIFLINSKFLYNFFLTRYFVYLLFNNRLFNKILKKIDK